MVKIFCISAIVHFRRQMALLTILEEGRINWSEFGREKRMDTEQ